MAQSADRPSMQDPLPELTTFPNSIGTQDEQVPTVSKLLSSVHRRLASIISISGEGDTKGANGADTNALVADQPAGTSSRAASPVSVRTPPSQSPPTAQSNSPIGRSRKQSISSELTNIPGLAQDPQRQSGILPHRSRKAPAMAESALIRPATTIEQEQAWPSSSTVIDRRDFSGLSFSQLGSGMPSRESSVNREAAYSSRSTISRPTLPRLDSLSTVLERIKSGSLSKEFWMKDSNVRACFRCEAPFTTFRRKHHCRLCGQIFCSSCTTLTSSYRLNDAQKFRACKTCSKIMDEYAALSSDTDQVGWSSEAEMLSSVRDEREATVLEAASFFAMPTERRPISTPLMGIPATRSPGHRSGRTHLEIPTAGLQAPTDTPRTASSGTQTITADEGQSNGTGPSNPIATLATQLTKRMPGAFRRAHTFHERPTLQQRKTSNLSFVDHTQDDVAHDGDDDETREAQGSRGSRTIRIESRRNSSHGEDGTSDALRKSRKRGIQKHVRTKSKSLLRQLGQSNLDNIGKLPTPSADSPIRRRARSRSYSGMPDSTFEDISDAGRYYAMAMLTQLLKDAHVADATVWSRALMPIVMKVPAYVRPKVKDGASGYINNYVKIKRIPGAQSVHSEFISGAVFTHKLAHKRMAREIHHPKILLVSFPIEYHRGDNQFLSLEPVLAQEKEFLRNLVNRMLALRPTLVLVEQSLCGLALDFLLEAGVTVAYNVKPSVIAVVAGLTGADIITSVDRLAFQPRVGRCEYFEVKTFLNYDEERPCKKTYLYLRGCPSDLGCTIILRGGDMRELEKIKKVVEFMAYLVYHLRLETSLLRDHSIAHGNWHRSAPDDESFSITSMEELRRRPFADVLNIFRHRMLAASPLITLPAPYILRKAQDLEARLKPVEAEANQVRELKEDKLQSVSMSRSASKNDDLSDLTQAQQLDVERILSDADRERMTEDLDYARRAWDAMMEHHANILLPSARQSISVLYSTVCSETGTPCSLPLNESFEFYTDSGIDCPLGQYVEDSIYAADQSCPTAICQRRNLEHHRSYVHGAGRISVIVEPFACPLTGMQQSILMWSYCKICKYTSPICPMSENSWAYSFGKYLQLTFYGSNLRASGGTCEHDFCHEHVRYFGFRDMAVRFDYDPVEIMSLVMPRPRVHWRPEGFIRLKNQEFKSIQFKISAYYDSLEFRLYNMNSEMLMLEELDAYKADLTLLRAQAKEERTTLIGLLQQIHDESDPLDYLCLNRALRSTQQKVVKWSETFEELEQLYMPADKDIRKLTAAHLKRLFLPDLTPEGATTHPQEEHHDDSEAKRSVSLPIVVEESSEKVEEGSKPAATTIAPEHGKEVSVGKSIEKMPSMPVMSPDSESSEPRGFHPKRHYDPLPKQKAIIEAQADTGTSASSDEISTRSEAVTTEDERRSSIPVPVPKPIEAATEDKSQLGSTSGSPPRKTHSRRSSDAKSSIPVLKPVAQAGGVLSHLRKKSVTNNHIFNKQLQDLSEAVVGSAERRWNEQRKAFSSAKDDGKKGKAGETRVSNLAKHFDQLSREFEKERLRARKLLRSRGRATFAVATARPSVSVFDNVDDAVDQTSDEEEVALEPLLEPSGEDFCLLKPTASECAAPPQAQATSEQAEATKNESTEVVPAVPTKAEEKASQSSKQDSESSLSWTAGERSTLMKALSNFWVERSSSSWTPLEYPLPATMHIFLESDVMIREDEPSSLIAFTLSAEEYLREIEALRQRARRKPLDLEQDFGTGAGKLKTADRHIQQTLQNATGTHMRFSWGGTDGSSVRLTSRIFFAEQFDALRRYCKCDENYVASLARCIKWDSSGGKSGAAFLKTQDERLIVKQLSKIETEQFLRFAPDYFSYMAESFFKGLPTCLCKILGFYQITSKNQVTGKFMKMDVLVMENLFYKRKTSRIFDLKGSMRNRKVQQTGRENEVLLDENFVELVAENPLFVRDHARRFLKSALHNDTLFLAQNNVMDYSLVVGIDDERHELVVGIIDFIRTYTWDKKLESWVKERGLVGGGSSGHKQPTVVTPKQYKVRFREAMDRYIFGVTAL